MIYQIPLRGKYGQGKYALIDDADYELIKIHNWRCYQRCAGGGFYAVTDIKTNGKWRVVGMHRFLLNAPIGMEVDHINGDTLDNRRSNLRIATRQQNSFNMKKRSNSHAKYKGVRARRNGQWSSNIFANGEHHYLGMYKTQEEAAVAYNNAALRFYGEFARLNILDSGDD